MASSGRIAVSYEWRGAFTNAELELLHTDGFNHVPRRRIDWATQVTRHSLGWVCARDTSALAGFVNVAWDGYKHAFLLDTLVSRSCRHQGIGAEVVALATSEARAAGCEWLHVDFDTELAPFYFDACGFRPTSAGLVHLGAD